MAGITFLAGLAIIAFPIAILGGTFLDLYLEMESRKTEQATRIAARKRLKEPSAEFTDFLEPVRSIRVQLEDLSVIVAGMEGLVSTIKVRQAEFNRAINLFNVQEHDEKATGAQVDNPGLKDIIYD